MVKNIPSEVLSKPAVNALQVKCFSVKHASVTLNNESSKSLKSAIGPIVAIEDYALNVLWLEQCIGIAVDHVFAPGMRSPLTQYFFWPNEDVWESLLELLMAMPWISEGAFAIPDVLKVRMQLQTSGAKGQNNLTSAKQSMIVTGCKMFKDEGIKSFYQGVIPSVVRGLIYGGCRLGFYEFFKRQLGVTKEQKSITKSVAAGASSGTLAAWITNPMDLVKCRLQVKNNKLGVLEILQNVIRENGYIGLWTGSLPAIVRTATMTAVQCATYDEAKQAWKRIIHSEDTLSTYLGASMISGLATTTLTAPIDVVKTNMFVDALSASANKAKWGPNEFEDMNKESLETAGTNSKPGLPYVENEDNDFCPTCLEPYTDDNPAIWTQCNHRYHLACIYEWLERKQTCPICECEMSFEELYK